MDLSEAFISNLRNVANLKDVRPVRFADGHATTVPASVALKAVNRYDAIRNPGQKRVAAEQMRSSLSNFKKSISEDKQLDEISDELKFRYLGKHSDKYERHYAFKRHGWNDDGKHPVPKASSEKAAQKTGEHFNRKWTAQAAEHKRQEEERDRKPLEHEPKVHDLRHLSHGEAYNRSQTDDKIKDGDVLHLKGGHHAIMYKAWPTNGPGSNAKEHHHLAAGNSWHHENMTRYHKSAKIAEEGAKKHLKESEEINEISKNTLGRYISHASMDKSHSAETIGFDNGEGVTTGKRTYYSRNEIEKDHKKHARRSAGIQHATMKLIGHDPHNPKWKMKRPATNEELEITEKTKFDDDADERAEAARRKKQEKSKVQNANYRRKEKYTMEDFDAMDDDEFDFVVENLEQLDELSKATLGRYVNRSLNDVRNANQSKIRWESKPKDDYFGLDPKGNRVTKTSAEMQKIHSKNATKREKGIRTAVAKLTKESEEINELSKATLGRYLDKSVRQSVEKAETSGYHSALNDYSHQVKADKAARKAEKRYAGSMTAIQKLTKEDFDIDEINEIMDRVNAGLQLDELSKATLSRYMDNASGDAWSSENKADAKKNGSVSQHYYQKRADKRYRGLEKADRKMNEDFDDRVVLELIEQFMAENDLTINELSDDTLKSYVGKSNAQLTAMKSKRGRKSAADLKTAAKRTAGGTKASKTLYDRRAKEWAKGEITSRSAYSKALHDTAKEHGYNLAHSGRHSDIYTKHEEHDTHAVHPDREGQLQHSMKHFHDLHVLKIHHGGTENHPEPAFTLSSASGTRSDGKHYRNWSSTGSESEHYTKHKNEIGKTFERHHEHVNSAWHGLHESEDINEKTKFDDEADDRNDAYVKNRVARKYAQMRKARRKEKYATEETVLSDDAVAQFGFTQSFADALLKISKPKS